MTAQSLASPGRWPPSRRRYPTHPEWNLVFDLFKKFTEIYGSSELLMRPALGKIDSSPFTEKAVSELKADVITGLSDFGLHMKSSSRDSPDVFLDCRFLELLLSAARDRDVALGSFAEGVWLGPGVRLPRLPALCKAKKKWSLPEQADPLLHLAEVHTSDHTWRNNYPAVAALAAEVTEVLEEHARRGQVFKLSEHDARSRFPGLVVASLGANKKENPGGLITVEYFTTGRMVSALTDGSGCGTRSDPPPLPKRVMREKASPR